MSQSIKDRASREAELYDRQQLRRAGFETALTYLNDGVGRLRRNEAIRAAMREATGLQVLEIGSQSWEWCLARYDYRPAQLTCINISQTELDSGRAQAAKLGVSCNFRRMDAHALEFADGTLDMVFGVAILHHLEFARALYEIHRVLRDGGKIVFVEPLRHNPVARVVRWLTPHARTPDELPLGRPELRLIARNFRVDNYYSELFTVIGAMVARPIFKDPINPLTRFCDLVDDRLVRMLPAAGAYYRSVVICATKQAQVGKFEVDGAGTIMLKNVIHRLGRMYIQQIVANEALSQNFKKHNERPIEYRFVFHCLTQLRPMTVLDVGTGTTALPSLIANCGCTVRAIDNVRDYWPNGMVNRHWQVIDDDIRRPKTADLFDMITCVSVIEHIDEPVTAFKSMITLLKPGGHLVLTTPYNEQRSVPNVYTLPGAAYGHDLPYICRSTSRREVDEWLRQTGSEIVCQELWQFWTGEVWTQGTPLPVPQRVNRNDPHQLTCLLVQKPSAG